VRRLVAAVAVATSLAVPTTAAAETQPFFDCPAFDPFTPAFAAEIAGPLVGHHLTAAVLDVRTGCAYAFAPGERVTTASVFKVELYAGVLLRAQQEGRWLTPREQALVWPMITESANPPASELFNSLGGVTGMSAVGDTFGLRETRPASPWGLTSTSVADQVRLVHHVAAGGPGPLSAPYRQALVDAMQAVVPSQRWGVSAGVPPGWVVALKNGFADSQCCGWRINSVGYVHPPGEAGYVVAILSDGWATQPDGIAAVELVSRAIAARLASSPFAGFPSPAAFAARVLTDINGSPASLPAVLELAAATGFDEATVGALVDGLLGGDASGRADLVIRLHRALTGADPDDGARGYWKDVVRHHRAAGLAGAMLATPAGREATAALDDAGFVGWAYERVLGRAPDPGGGGFWTAEVARRGRPAVLLELATSAEGVARFAGDDAVVQVYDALLHRTPSPEELAGWRGTTRAALAAAAVSSPEYHS
jgi:hypothetical protein